MLRGLPTCGQNVWTGRPYPLQPAELPGIVIAVMREISDTDSIGDVHYMRLEQLIIIVEANSDTVEDDLDNAASDVERAFGINPTMDGLIKDSILKGTSINIMGDGRIRAGEMRLTFEVSYRTARGAPDTLVQ